MARRRILRDNYLHACWSMYHITKQNRFAKINKIETLAGYQRYYLNSDTADESNHANGTSCKISKLVFINIDR